MSEALSSNAPVGEVDMRSFLGRDAAYEYVTSLVDVRQAMSTERGLSLIRNNGVSVFLSRDHIGAVTAWLSGKPKDVHTWRSGVMKAREYARMHNLTPAQQSECIPYVATVAFLTSVKQDGDALHALQRGLTPTWWDRQKRILSGLISPLASMGALPSKWSLWDYNRQYEDTFAVSNTNSRWDGFSLGLGAAALAAAGFYLGRRSQPLYVIKAAAAFSFPPLESFISGFWRLGAMLVGLWANYTWSTAVGLPNEDVCCQGRKLAKMHPTAKYTSVPPADRGCYPKFGNQQVGPDFSFAKPVVARSCEHNLEIAIVNRALMYTEYDTTAWDAFETWLASKPHLCPVSPLPDFDFDQWLSRFPPGRREVLRLAKENVDDGTYPTRRDGKATAFVKRENQVKLLNGEFESFDPRLIQAQTSEHQVVTATFTYPFNKALATSMGARDGLNLVKPDTVPVEQLKSFNWARIVYASGMNAVQIGVWYDWAVNDCFSPYAILVAGDDCFAIIRHGHITRFLYLDFNRWDAHFHMNAHSLRLRLYIKFGLSEGDPAYKALAKQRYVSGVTALGHKYSVQGTVQSGVSDTSCANSYVNGHMVAFALERSSLAKRGDEGWTDFCDTLSLLGFPCEGGITFDPSTPDFCSGIFLPSSNGLRLSPKIGRLISKTFTAEKYRTDKGQREWLRGVLVGLMPAVNHVPIVRALFWRLLHLTRGSKAKYYKLPPLYLGLTPADATYETFDWVCSRYDITMSDIHHLESEVSKIATPLVSFHGVLWERIFSVDVASLGAQHGMLANLDPTAFALIATGLLAASYFSRPVRAITHALGIVVGNALINDYICQFVASAAIGLATCCSLDTYDVAVCATFASLTTRGIAAAFLEETGKKRNWLTAVLIGSIEAVTLLSLGAPFTAAFTRLAMHISTLLLSLPAAIALHATYNVVAIAGAITGISSPLTIAMGLSCPADHDLVWSGVLSVYKALTGY